MQEKEEYIDEDIELLNKNQLKTINDWKNLTNEQKINYPCGLRIILDETENIFIQGILLLF